MIDLEDVREDIFDKLTSPYIYYAQDTLGQKCLFSGYIKNIKPEILLLPSCYIFSYPSVIAGLTEEQITYIAKYAPSDYKIQLRETFCDKFKIKEIFEIAKNIDNDLGTNIEYNQERVKKVLQYIKDNIVVFQF